MRRYLSNPHSKTYNQLFQHPLSHNVEWRDVRALFQALGEVTEEHNGHLEFVVNGHTLNLPQPHDSSVLEADQVILLRHFLEASGQDGITSEAVAKDILIVIDHSEARIFRLEMKDELPEKVVPHDPHGLGKHVHNIHTDISIHQKANRKSFYEGIAKTVEGADRILVFGDGVGSSSEMTLFVEELQHHHPKTAALILGTSTVDLHHQSDGQLLAKARQFMENAPAPV